MNSLIPTGISSNKSPSPPPALQFVSLPPPSSSMLIATFLDFSLRACNAALASALFAAHSSMSSRYMSHTQFTHPDIQQLSGSVGRGGTMTPAISCDFASISAFRSAGPAIRDPNTIRAFSRVSSFCVFGSDPVGGGLGAVRVKGCTFDIGLDMISRKNVNVLKEAYNKCSADLRRTPLSGLPGRRGWRSLCRFWSAAVSGCCSVVLVSAI
jgi:hypothetical protein